MRCRVNWPPTDPLVYRCPHFFVNDQKYACFYEWVVCIVNREIGPKADPLTTGMPSPGLETAMVYPVGVSRYCSKFSVRWLHLWRLEKSSRFGVTWFRLNCISSRRVGNPIDSSSSDKFCRVTTERMREHSTEEVGHSAPPSSHLRNTHIICQLMAVYFNKKGACCEQVWFLQKFFIHCSAGWPCRFDTWILYPKMKLGISAKKCAKLSDRE